MQFSYPLLLERARHYNVAEAINELTAVGPPPYDAPEKYWVSFAESRVDRDFAWPIVAATVVWVLSILHGGRPFNRQLHTGA
jgi:hypothetical protein